MSKLKFSHVSAAFVVAASLALTACGSGSSSGPDTTIMRTKNAALGVQEGNLTSMVSVHAGGHFTVTIDDAGKLHAWGVSINGQLNVPALKPGATKFVTVSSGYFHALALDDKGQMYAWGNNVYGETTIPALKNGGTKFVAVSAGNVHSVAIDDKGQLYVFGSSSYNSMAIPVLKNGGTKFVSVAAGFIHSVAIDDKGQLYPWGNNGFGALTAPALKAGSTKFVAVTATQFHSAAIDDKGQWYGWGSNGNGQTNAPALRNGATKLVSISSMEMHNVAIDDMGQLYDWGAYSAPTPTLKTGATKFVSASAGRYHGAAIDDLGNTYAWGSNGGGQLNIPESFTMKVPKMPIAMGGFQAYGIEDTGTISKFDAGPDGYQINEAGPFNYVAAGARHALAVTADGHVVAWGDYVAGQTEVPEGLANVVQVAAGYAYSVALRADGKVAEWGSWVGPSKTMVAMPADLPSLASITGGMRHVLGITRTGTVVAWGDNRWGQATVPAGLTNVISVATKWDCNAALKSDGSITYWGPCLHEMTTTTSVAGAKSLVMSDQAVIALKSDGSLVAWGANPEDPILTVPEGKDFAAVTAGYDAAMAVTKTGTVVTWGMNGGYTVTIPVGFGGTPPAEGEECTDCNYEAEPYTPTDEDIDQVAAAWYSMLTQAQRDRFIKALGGTPGTQLSPEEIDALVKAASASQKAAATAVVATPAPSPVETKAAVLPATQDPVTKVGTVVTTAQAVSILGLGKVTKVSFVLPKKAIPICSVTKSKVTASGAGRCSVVVKYTKAKKAKKATLTLFIG